MLTSIKQPVDAFAVPPRVHLPADVRISLAGLGRERLLAFLINSVVISVGTVVTSVSIGTMAVYGLSRLSSSTSRGLLFGLLAMRMFPHILLAIPFFVLARILGW